MSSRYSQGNYSVQNPEKFVGQKQPFARSSWEMAFMRFCDSHPNITKWASENVKIPYRHPFTGKYTVYVPDFFIVYMDKNGRKHAEMIEVKPMSQTNMESAGKSMAKKKQVVINSAKWEAASAYAKQRRIGFRVVSEEQLFHNGKRK